MTFFYNLFREREREREERRFSVHNFDELFQQIECFKHENQGGSDFKRLEKMNYIQENIMMMMKRGHYQPWDFGR